MGPLRVFNDDIVYPHCGFPTHLHQNQEILTIVISGEMTHYDSLGNKIIIAAGDAHYLLAGKGIRHSELNFSDKPVHYYQLWFTIPPHISEDKSERIRFKAKKWQNKIFPIASGQGFDNTLTLANDVTVYRSELQAGKTLFYDLSENRLILLYITSGTLILNNLPLKPGDQARINNEKQLVLTAKKTCSYILIDLPSNMGWGYSEKTLKGVKIKNEKNG